MDISEIKPGETVEITLTVTVSKVEHYEHAGPGDIGPGFTAIEFAEYQIPATQSGRTTSAFTLELPDDADYAISSAD